VKHFLSQLIQRCHEVESNPERDTTPNASVDKKDEQPAESAAKEERKRSIDDPIADLKVGVCTRLLQRIDLIDSLRNNFLSLSDEEQGIVAQSLHKTVTLPKWWEQKKHDVSLIHGVLKHGLGKWDDIIQDPDLEFFKILQSVRKKLKRAEEKAK